MDFQINNKNKLKLNYEIEIISKYLDFKHIVNNYTHSFHSFYDEFNYDYDLSINEKNNIYTVKLPFQFFNTKFKYETKNNRLNKEIDYQNYYNGGYGYYLNIEASNSFFTNIKPHFNYNINLDTMKTLFVMDNDDIFKINHSEVKSEQINSIIKFILKNFEMEIIFNYKESEIFASTRIWLSNILDDYLILVEAPIFNNTDTLSTFEQNIGLNIKSEKSTIISSFHLFYNFNKYFYEIKFMTPPFNPLVPIIYNFNSEIKSLESINIGFFIERKINNFSIGAYFDQFIPIKTTPPFEKTEIIKGKNTYGGGLLTFYFKYYF